MITKKYTALSIMKHYDWKIENVINCIDANVTKI